MRQFRVLPGREFAKVGGEGLRPAESPALRIVEPGCEFVAYSVASDHHDHLRREDARNILVELLARYCLAGNEATKAKEAA